MRNLKGAASEEEDDGQDAAAAATPAADDNDSDKDIIGPSQPENFVPEIDRLLKMQTTEGRRMTVLRMRMRLHHFIFCIDCIVQFNK